MQDRVGQPAGLGGVLTPVRARDLRDFYQIEERRLVDEIDILKDTVEEPVSEALHALRRIASIAVHTENDPNVIVGVDRGEASALIELIELLILETYVATERRKATRVRAQAIADETARSEAGNV